MIKGTAEKINMILFGRKKFISKILNTMPQLSLSHLSFPFLLLLSSAASRKGTKSLVSECCRTQHGIQAHTNEVMVRQRPGPQEGDGRGRPA